MSDRQPVADQRAKGRQHVVGAVVQCPCADGRRELCFIGEPEFGQPAGDLGRGAVGQFSLDDAQHIGRDAGMEIDLAIDGRPHVIAEEVSDRGDELSRSWPSIQPVHFGPLSGFLLLACAP